MIVFCVSIVVEFHLKLELIATYISSIAIPLSFFICSREKRNLIYNLIPEKIRKKLERISCKPKIKPIIINVVPIYNVFNVVQNPSSYI